MRRVEREFQRNRDGERRLEPAERARCPGGEQDAADRAGGREHQALGEKLPDESRTTAAEREAHRHLTPPRRPAREQQVGQVGAADRQHQAGDSHEQREELGDGTADARNDPGVALREHRDDPRTAGAVGPALAVGPMQPRGDDAELGLHHFDGDAGLETAEEEQPAVAPIGEHVVAGRKEPLRGQRRPRLDANPAHRAGEAFGGHAYDREGLAREADASADHVGRTAEPLPPEAVADDGFGLGTGDESPAPLERNAEHAEIVLAHHLAHRAESLGCRRDAERAGREGGKPREPGRALGEVDEIGIGGGAEAGPAEVAGEQRDDLLRLAHVGGRAQEDRVDHAEDRGGGADPQGQHRDGERREPRRADQLANREAQVLAHAVQHHSARSVLAGSTRMARRAGTREAASATAAMRQEIATNVAGSSGRTA